MEAAWGVLHSGGFFQMDEQSRMPEVADDGPDVLAAFSSSLLRSYTPAKFSLSKSFCTGSVLAPNSLCIDHMGSSLRDHALAQGEQPLEQLAMSSRTAEALVLGSVGEEAFVVVDPMSTGASFAAELYGTRPPRGNRRVQIVRVFSEPFAPDVANYLPPVGCAATPFICTLQFYATSRFVLFCSNPSNPCTRHAIRTAIFNSVQLYNITATQRRPLLSSVSCHFASLVSYLAWRQVLN